MAMPRGLHLLAPALRRRNAQSSRPFSASATSRLPNELQGSVDNAVESQAGLIFQMSDHFLQLPELLHLPSYTSSIVVTTLALRFAFTVPMQIWQRKRTARLKNLVTPEARAFNKTCSLDLRSEYRRLGKNYDEYVAEFNRRVSCKVRL